ncbi:MAG: hypothetical protein QN178_17325 [Armatimonadota bacterium]|nr:hypothetical protein [Armatimonadota bacterium]
MGFSPVSDAVALGRMVRGLATVIYRPSTPERAQALMRRRLARRGDLFLEMVWTCIWTRPASPYRRLLEWAGWSFESVRESVERRGVDDTLRALADAGVRLSFDEFKGKRPIERGTMTLPCREADFDNPRVLAAYADSTGGTRSSGSRVPASMEFLTANRAPARMTMLDALGAGHLPVIVAMQFSSGLLWWLSLAHMRRPLLRWFGLAGVAGFTLSPARGTLIALARAMAATCRYRLAPLELLASDGPDVLLDAVVAALAAHHGCVVTTTPSLAVRVAHLARRRDLDLRGVVFVTQNEPLTPGKHADIVSTGARAAGRYGFTEAGSIAEGCARPASVDDAHLMTDCYGLVEDRRTLPNGRIVSGLVVTGLLSSSPKVLLNVESDDFADVSSRRCGCLFDEMGMHVHLENIRSFSKLTGEGTTLLGTEAVQALEEVLPREFGGTSVDYQLLEAEDADHLTRLYLLVSPSVGPVDEERVVARFLEALGGAAAGYGTLPPLWQQSQTLRVLRREPIATATGKLLPLHTHASVPPMSGEAGASANAAPRTATGPSRTSGA